MQLNYLVEIKDPKNHMVKVTITGTKDEGTDFLCFYLPSWSPGSYLMREYSRHVRYFKASNNKGEFLSFEQVAKGSWMVNFAQSSTQNSSANFCIEYEVYCHELTVRTSHVDITHAFLHGPSYLMGIEGMGILNPVIEFKFPPLWMKLHTSLKEISTSRERFVFTAATYDDLIDCPVEIGCHESDGFIVNGVEHHIVVYGQSFPHANDFKGDIKKITETVARHFKGPLPYERYVYIIHLRKDLYGGLEHKSSTALHFDPRKLANRSDYLTWLSLVAHEYFHTWNVKRIRPLELGPFDYLTENYTRMHWLTEGLTSFMDELFVLRAGMCSLEEYLEMQVKNLDRYFSIPGRKFHSVEDSSFNAWIKLYRPDENSNNSSISYYLKGGLIFSILHFELRKHGKKIDDLLTQLWQRYQDNKDAGMVCDEVLEMIEKISNKKLREKFDLYLKTTEEIDFETAYKEIGLNFVWSEEKAPYLGVDWNQATISSVHLDGPAHKSGLNAGDEILAINGVRFTAADVANLSNVIMLDTPYIFTISRLSKLMEVEVYFGPKPRKLKQIAVIDRDKAMQTFL